MIGSLLFILAILSLVFNLVRVEGVSIPDATFLAVLIVVIVVEGLLKRKPFKSWIPFHPLVPPAFLILVGGLISSVNAVSVSSSVGITLKQFYTFTIFISLGIFMARKMRPDTLALAIIGSGLITAFAAINDFFLGYKFSNELLMNMGSLPINESWDRYAGLLGHPNEQAMFLAVVLPLAFSRLMISFDEDLGSTILNFCILMVLGSALLLTGSVSGYLGAAVSSLICLVWFLRSANKSEKFLSAFFTRSVLGSLVLVLLAAVVFNSSAGSRLLNSDLFSQFQVTDYLLKSLDRVVTTTAVSRWDDFLIGFRYILDNPLVGAGMDQSGTGGLDPSQLVTTLAIHNTILQSWVAGGLLTFFGTVLIYWHVLKTAFLSLAQKVQSKASYLMVGLAASSVGFVLIDMTSSNIYQRVKWLVFAILLGLTVLEPEESTAPATEPLTAN